MNPPLNPDVEVGETTSGRVAVTASNIEGDYISVYLDREQAARLRDNLTRILNNLLPRSFFD